MKTLMQADLMGSHTYRQKSNFLSVAGLVLVFLTGATPAQAADALEQGFLVPPDSAKPGIMWPWNNGNVSKIGITADLEAMARIGISGALIYFGKFGEPPPGPVPFLSPQWREMMKHAVKEAARLGLTLKTFCSDGWSGSGGPWIAPEHSMKVMTSSSLFLEGPKDFDAQLPLPPHQLDFYRDVGVFAFPGSGQSMYDCAPKVLISAPDLDGALLVDGNLATEVELPDETPHSITIKFPESYTASSLVLTFGDGRRAFHGRLEFSEDGEQFKPVCPVREGPGTLSPGPVGASFPKVSGKAFRLTFDEHRNRTKTLKLREIELSPLTRIDDWSVKAGYTRLLQGSEKILNQSKNEAAILAIPLKEIVDLSNFLDQSGRLKWKVPPGQWTVVRLGYSVTAGKNHPASEAGLGLESDRFEKSATQVMYDGMVAKVAADIGPLAGKTLKLTHIDSWENGAQSWSASFPSEFKKRRGYEPGGYLLTMVGLPVESAERSERFLWDVRLTQGELIADNYFGELARLSKQHGMGLEAQPYGNGNFNNLQCAARLDATVGTFWTKPDRVDPHFPDELSRIGTQFAPDPMKTGVFHQIVPF